MHALVQALMQALVLVEHAHRNIPVSMVMRYQVIYDVSKVWLKRAHHAALAWHSAAARHKLQAADHNPETDSGDPCGILDIL